GRLPENDLAIPDSNLSRRHAVIENFDGAFFISDCGSENGTAVNGKPVTAAVQLRDGDLITLGGAKELTVHLGNGRAGATQGPPPALFDPHSSSVSARAPTQAGAGWNSTPSWMSAPVIAGSAVVLIVLMAGLFLALSLRSGPETKPRASRTDTQRRQQTLPDNVNSDNSSVNQLPAADSSPGTAVNASPETSPVTNRASNDGGGSDDLDEVEKYALRALTSVSKDTSPTLSRRALAEINERVKRYRGSSSLAEGLRVMKQRGAQQLAPGAKSGDLKLPLLVYAALAKMDRDGERGDPVPVAQRMLPVLSRLRVTFGTELANDSLLIIAAYDQGPGGTTHPLQTTIFELAKRQPESPATIRTVWYLRDHQKLGAQSYDLVLRFLAVGVVAQDPRKFGVDAEPLGL
ncbi:MAG TPA: FHA domain-containing protein, partial [Pyrinomonadaceae bacterium]